MPGHLDTGEQNTDSANTKLDRILPSVFRKFYNDSGSTIAVGQAVSLDLSKAPVGSRIQIYTGTATTDGHLIIGVAMQAIPTGTWGKVIVRGLVVDAEGTPISCNVVTATALGAVLVGGAAAGRFAIQSATYTDTHRPVALAYSVAASNLGLVYVLPNAYV